MDYKVIKKKKKLNWNSFPFKKNHLFIKLHPHKLVKFGLSWKNGTLIHSISKHCLLQLVNSDFSILPVPIFDSTYRYTVDRGITWTRACLVMHSRRRCTSSQTLNHKNNGMFSHIWKTIGVYKNVHRRQCAKVTRNIVMLLNIIIFLVILVQCIYMKY